MKPDLSLETTVKSTLANVVHIAGLDEAGRGAVAGPVVAAAVILPLHAPDRLKQLVGVHDSKQIPARRREALFSLIRQHALTCGIGACDASDIDEIGIVAATKRAMTLALAQLVPAPDYLLIDGRLRLQNTPLRQQAVIRGDSRSLSVAAASILAKVTRDRQMVTLSHRYPQYGFARHKGYGTPQHLAALAKHGPSEVHRHSFAPIRQTLL